MMLLLSLVALEPEPTAWADKWLMPLIMTLIGGGSLLGGVFTWLKSRKEINANAEQEYVKNLRGDVAGQKIEIAALRQELDDERDERKADGVQFAVALNAFRARDGVWFQHYHRMTEAVIAKNGEIPTFPPQLNEWPESIIEVAKRAGDAVIR